MLETLRIARAVGLRNIIRRRVYDRMYDIAREEAEEVVERYKTEHAHGIWDITEGRIDQNIKSNLVDQMFSTYGAWFDCFKDRVEGSDLREIWLNVLDHHMIIDIMVMGKDYPWSLRPNYNRSDMIEFNAYIA